MLQAVCFVEALGGAAWRDPRLLEVALYITFFLAFYFVLILETPNKKPTVNIAQANV